MATENNELRKEIDIMQEIENISISSFNDLSLLKQKIINDENLDSDKNDQLIQINSVRLIIILKEI